MGVTIATAGLNDKKVTDEAILFSELGMEFPDLYVDLRFVLNTSSYVLFSRSLFRVGSGFESTPSRGDQSAQPSQFLRATWRPSLHGVVYNCHAAASNQFPLWASAHSISAASVATFKQFVNRGCRQTEWAGLRVLA